MRKTTLSEHWRKPASAVPWFNLARHDEGDPNPADPDPGNPDPDPAAGDPDGGDPDPDPADPAADPDPEPDGLGDKGKQALERMKADRAKARQGEAAQKKRADDLARKVAEFEDAQKTETERLAAKAEASAKREAAAIARAVKAEVKSLASDAFADPSDASVFLDLSRYTDDSGEIDTDAIQSDLEDLLESKPHLRKPAPAAPSNPAAPPKPKPKPDPGQGSRTPPPPVDYRTASKEELAAALSSDYGYRQRSY